MKDRKKQLLRKYVLLGLRELNKSNYLEGIPEYEDQEEQEAFSESLEVIGRYIATGNQEEITEILGL